MSTATDRSPAAISDSSRQKLARLAWASSLIICSLVMLVVGIMIGSMASKRISKQTRGFT
jgi:hypothetical protein